MNRTYTRLLLLLMALVLLATSVPVMAQAAAPAGAAASAPNAIKITLTKRATAAKMTIPSKKTLYITTLEDDPDLDGKDSYRLVPTMSASIEDRRGEIQYKPSKISVAKVDPTGVITGLKAGTAVITAWIPGTKCKDTIKVTVKYHKPKFVSLVDEHGCTTAELQPGNTRQLSATVWPAHVKNKSVTYSSSKKSVAKVSSTGLVTALKPGTATITVKTRSGCRKASYKVTVGYNYRFYGIANGIYKSKYAPNLACYTKDIATMKSIYSAARFDDGGKVRMSYRKNLTGSGIKSYLKAIAKSGQNFGDNDVTFIYFSGHGDGNGSWVGTDANILTGAGMVSVSTVQNYLNKIKGHVVVLIDCCYSGKFIEVGNKGLYAKAMGRAETTLFNQSIINEFSKGAASKAMSGGAASKAFGATSQYHVLTACSPDELSWMDYIDGYGYASYMTVYFRAATLGGVSLQYLNGTDRFAADQNNDGMISLGEVYDYIKDPVLKISEDARKYEDPRGIYQDITSSSIMFYSEGDSPPIFAIN